MHCMHCMECEECEYSLEVIYTPHTKPLESANNVKQWSIEASTGLRSVGFCVLFWISRHTCTWAKCVENQKNRPEEGSSYQYTTRSSFKPSHNLIDCFTRMPKKFAGENSKAVAAKARKEEKKKDEESRKQKAAEDEYWKDDDKLINRKTQRKEDLEKKKLEALQKKAEAKALLEQEVSSIKVTTGKQSISKVTRQQIMMETEKRAQAAHPGKTDIETHISQPLPENVNRLQVDGEEARTIEEAISVLSVKETEVDKHPEKRMKAAFTAFEETNMPRIKSENPTLRLSQLKQILRKEWMKSPDNPANQRLS